MTFSRDLAGLDLEACVAGLSIGKSNARAKAVDHELPLVPFIDFLLCLVSFLLITAVWAQAARVEADARVPGPSESCGCDQDHPRLLHVYAKADGGVDLVWQIGPERSRGTPIASLAPSAQGSLVTALSEQIAAAWSQNPARHVSETDLAIDRAVLHAGNDVPFAKIVHLIDAIKGPERSVRSAAGGITRRPVFDVSLSTD
jgi:hypothetical protein